MPATSTSSSTTSTVALRSVSPASAPAAPQRARGVGAGVDQTRIEFGGVARNRPGILGNFVADGHPRPERASDQFSGLAEPDRRIDNFGLQHLAARERQQLAGHRRA